MSGPGLATYPVPRLVKTSALPSVLTPVVEALWDSARSAERILSSAAETDTVTELASARAEAERILSQARADGERAAEQSAALHMARAHREAGERVLEARRAAYETLRQRALKALEERGPTPRGRRLADLLETLVRERVGEPAKVTRSGPGLLDVRAERHNSRATVGAAELIDIALHALSAEVESLWA